MKQSLARPYRVPASMIFLLTVIPLYILVPEFFPPAQRYAPELPLDRALPLIPLWAVVYGAVYVFLILLPIFVVRDYELLRNTMRSYLLIWITAYVVFFVLYPTVAPRPEKVSGEGFGMWGLSALYRADPPFNCFPSLHVAHSFVSALACSRVHRRLGIIALCCAAIVALSTLFTKQHYVLDAITGVLLAFAAYAIFLRRYQLEPLSEIDHAAAPSLALLIAGVVVVGVAGWWLAYALLGQTQFTFGP